MEFSELALLAWIPISAMLFVLFRPIKAVGLAYLIGYLLLPVAAVDVKGFWDVDKILATNFGVILGTIAFCPGMLRSYRFHIADALMVLTCLVELPTSMSNGLGAYDGVSNGCYAFFWYGAPYVAGRIHIRTREDLLELGRLIVIAAAMYAPLALWEWRMSPQFHDKIYGTFQHAFQQHHRMGHFRPILFFPHALALGVFFAWTSFLAIWLYQAGHLRRLVLPEWLVTFGPLVAILASLQFGVEAIAFTCIACLGWVLLMMIWTRKLPAGRRGIMVPGWLVVVLPMIGLATSMSVGPLVVFLAGCALLIAWNQLHLRWVAFVPLVFVLFWMAGRYTGVTDGRWLTRAVHQVSPRAADSLAYRIRAEDVILEHAKKRALFGWGGWGRNRVVDERGKGVVNVDALWLNRISRAGFCGLASFLLWWCWPILMLGDLRHDLRGAPVIQVTLVAVAMQALNFMFNGFLSPVLVLMVGCAVTVLASVKRIGLREPVPRVFPVQI